MNSRGASSPVALLSTAAVVPVARRVEVTQSKRDVERREIVARSGARRGAITERERKLH
jgi:hypothetical protein